jgi:hypothetical protein
MTTPEYPAAIVQGFYYFKSNKTLILRKDDQNKSTAPAASPLTT